MSEAVNFNRKKPVKGQGVRKLTLKDQAPDCEILINRQLFDLKDLVKDKKVVDIGCGYGATRSIVESVGGEWTGVEPFEGGAHTVVADAQDMPFADNTFDVVIMNAVLEHIPDVSKAFAEVGRVLKPGGIFVGYVAFMECFHEISYSHLSFKALENFATINGMKLEKLAGGAAFGIDYHLHVLVYPLPFNFMRRLIAASIRGLILIKSYAAYWGLQFKRRLPRNEARDLSSLYYKIECLRQSQGFNFIIRKTSFR